MSSFTFDCTTYTGNVMNIEASLFSSITYTFAQFLYFFASIEPSSSNGDDDDKEDDDCDDDDDDDHNECNDDDDDDDNDCDDASTADVSVHDPASDDEGLAEIQPAKFASKQKTSCKTSSVIQNMKTTDSFTSLSLLPSIITSSSMSHLMQSRITSSTISPSATKSVSHLVGTSTVTLYSVTLTHPPSSETKIISPSTFPGISPKSVASSGSSTSTPSLTSPLSSSVNLEPSVAATSVVFSTTLQYSEVNSTVVSSSFNGTANQSSSITSTMTLLSSSVILESNASIAISSQDVNIKNISTSMHSSSFSTFTKVVSMSTAHQKPGMSGPFPGISPTLVVSSSIYSSTSSQTPPLSSSVVLESNTNVVIPPSDGNGTQTSTRITILPSSTLTRVASMSPTHQKPRMSGTLFGTLSPSTFPGIPPTFVASSSCYSSTSSPTPPLSSSVNLEPSIAATSVVFSTTLQHSEANSTVVSSSFNGTVNQSSSITPTMTTTVLASSSIIQQRTGNENV